MKDIIKLIGFISYTIILFFIRDYRIFAICTCVQGLLLIGMKISVIRALKNLQYIAIFILFTMLINGIVTGLQEAILIGVRLTLICNMTYLFSKNMTSLRMGEMIEKLLMPLKIIGIHSQNIGIIIAIAMAFVPILQQEIRIIRYTLKAKGFNTQMIHLIPHMNLILVPLFVSILRKINEMEYALKAKAYMEE